MSNRIEFSIPPTDFRLAAQDAVGGVKSPRSAFGLKEIQRRAFERGVAVERAKYSKTLSELLETVRSQSASMAAGIAKDREQIEGFAVRLAIRIAEKLTCSIVDAESHDVVTMVKQLLDEVDSNTKSHGLTLKLNPRDHAAIVEAADATQISLDGLDVVPEASVAVGSPVIVGGDTEYYADMNERLAEIRSAMLEESLHAGS